MTIAIQCACCLSKLRAPDRLFRQKIPCPKCKAMVFVVPPEPPPVPPMPPPVPQPPPVPIELTPSRASDVPDIDLDPIENRPGVRPTRLDVPALPRPSRQRAAPAGREPPGADEFRGPDVGRHGKRASFSAKVLHFPRSCCCCMRPANERMLASAFRINGVRIVRAQAHAWPFPACEDCAEHVEAWASAGRSLRRAKAAAVACLGAAARMKGLGAIVIGLPGLAVGLGIAATLVPLAALGSAGARKRVRRMATARCACLSPAVEYLGWQGSVQHFEFHNPAFAEAFRDANRSKLVG